MRSGRAAERLRRDGSYSRIAVLLGDEQPGTAEGLSIRLDGWSKSFELRDNVCCEERDTLSPEGGGS